MRFRSVFTAFAAVFLCVIAATAQVAPRILLNYTGEGATTAAWFDNWCGHVVQFPGSTICTPIGCHEEPGPTLADATSGFYFLPVPNNGTAGLVPVTPPEACLHVYSRTVTGAGALFQHEPLQAAITASYSNLQNPENARSAYNGWVFIGVVKPTALQVDGKTYQLKAYDAIVIPPGSGGSPTYRALLGAEIYTVGGINSQSNGSLTIVEPRITPP